MSIYIAIIGLFICIFLMFIGILSGKNLPEKIMSLSCMNNFIVGLLCLISLFPGRDSFVDIAYIYILFGFVFNLAIKKLYDGRND
ncbi:MAG: monovalent cation/H+ antiporter complex subunit F [Pseudomonadota bacterium]